MIRCGPLGCRFKLDFSFFLIIHILHVYGDQTKTKKLQRQNKHWDAECYRQLAAANDEEGERDYGDNVTGPIARRRDDDNHHHDSDSDYSHNNILPTSDWNDEEDHEYDDEYDNEYDDEDDDEYDSDNEMYTKKNTIENNINIIDDKSYVANTTVHTTNHTDKYTIIKTPWLPPITNTINESSISSEVNIIEDDPDNNINGKNAAKKKEKALRRQKAASIRRTEKEASRRGGRRRRRLLSIIIQREEGMNQEKEECTENTIRDKFF